MFDQLANARQRTFRLGLRSAHHHAVIGVTDQAIPLRLHRHIDRVQIDVCQKRTDHAALSSALLECGVALCALQDPLLQIRFNQLQHEARQTRGLDPS